MSAAKPNVCQHAKRGICPSCADPMRATPSSEVNRVTDFGQEIHRALKIAGLTAQLTKRNRPRRNRRRRHNNQSNQTNG